MKWMKIGYLKMHSRIDYDCEDALLEQYGEAAEEFVLAYIERTYENLLDIYGDIPARLYECVQLLVDNMYQNRSMVTMTNMSNVPYTFETMVADFMRHTKETPIECERDTLLTKLDVLDSDFTFATRETPSTQEIEQIKTQFTNLKTLYKEIAMPTKKICASLRSSLATLTAACDPYINPVNHEP
jgi:uncharacterized phage protein (predicted DNA packaging)